MDFLPATTTNLVSCLCRGLQVISWKVNLRVFWRTIVLKNGMDFLFAHNQGSFQIMDFPYLKEDGKLSNIRKGAAYEHFEDCVYDFDAWLNFVSNYESVHLVVHSLGCNKVVYYLQERQPSNLKKLV